jgi:hypothetical protein
LKKKEINKLKLSTRRILKPIEKQNSNQKLKIEFNKKLTSLNKNCCDFIIKYDMYNKMNGKISVMITVILIALTVMNILIVTTLRVK